ncbi:MAG TPA: TerB family tellurite resistance protein [Longimicrobiales bacterium]|nr:TerB family tellurite resistance protein [Longimicrobiales bacterium]
MDPIKKFFAQRMQPDAPTNGNGLSKGKPDPLHVAACALLLELAHADETFTEAERQHIHAIMMRHFALDFDTAQELMQLAEEQRRQSVDVFQFANLVRSSYDVGQKTLLAEIMWGLILTDGEIARHESYMLRKIANLLDLEPGYLSKARAAAAAKLGGDA